MTRTSTPTKAKPKPKPKAATAPSPSTSTNAAASASASAPASASASAKPLEEFALRLGDDALIMSHRLTQWITRAPELEDEVALANIALDLLGQARAMLAVAGRSSGRTEDELAFERTDDEYRNALLTELPTVDFADTVVRLLFFATYQCLWYAELAGCADQELAALAAKAGTEVAYHRQYAETWAIRLGDGTEESHERMARALADLWPYTGELFAQDDLIDQLTAEGLAPDPAPVYGRWLEQVTETLIAATLGPPPSGTWRPAGGRYGVHTEALAYLLAEMQSVYRAHPGAAW
ncbi:MAG TPA: 1,2-phenylacetyl-CoA epoxidase subunit PaaC [Actinocrinis sp.]|nr:1,2-phenylacetyl-CoA epoxidase subunit PaaC [Actinocrinis sp.]